MNNLFGRLATCPSCDGPMAFVDKGPKPKGSQYLQCDKARRGLLCEKQAFRYDTLEPVILTYCKGLDASEILPGSEQRQSELSVLQNQLQAVVGELGEVQEQIDNLGDSIANTKSRDLRKALEAKLTARLKRKAQLKNQQETSLAHIDNLSRSGHDTEAQLKTVRQLIAHMNKLQGQERVSLRLNLRGQLRRLLTEIVIQQHRNSPIYVLLRFRTGLRRCLEIADARMISVREDLPKERSEVVLEGHSKRRPKYRPRAAKAAQKRLFN